MGSDVPASAAAPRLQTFSVALVFFAVGQPIVGGQHGLGALQVRVGGHDHMQVARRTVHEGPLQFGEQAVHAVDRVAGPEPQVGGHLVVATAARMQFAAHVPQAVDQRLLDVHVHIFQFLPQGKLAPIHLAADDLQRRLDLPAFVVRQDADLGQHLRMGDGAPNIVGIESVVEADAFGECFHASIRRLLEDAATRRT
jgi:hypothetical protein